MKENDNQIAKFLGWYQDGLPGVWYKDSDNAQYAVYSLHNNYPYNNLPFSRDWNYLMALVEKINATHNDGIVARDLAYTINYLLSGGYKFGNDKLSPLTKPLSPLTLTLHNLYERCAMFCEYYNLKNK